MDTLGGSLGVVGSLGTGLDVGRDTVVVRSGEDVQVVECLEGDGVLGCAETGGGGVAGDLALSDVVGGFSTEKETITANDGVSSQSWALYA